MLAKKRKSTKGEWRSILIPIIIGFIGVFVISFLMYSNFNMTKKRTELRQEAEELMAEIRILEERNRMLEAGIDKAGSEAYWEEKAREQGYEKEGEQTVVVLPPKGQEEEEEEPKRFWDKLKEKFDF